MCDLDLDIPIQRRHRYSQYALTFLRDSRVSGQSWRADRRVTCQRWLTLDSHTWMPQRHGRISPSSLPPSRLFTLMEPGRTPAPPPDTPPHPSSRTPRKSLETPDPSSAAQPISSPTCPSERETATTYRCVRLQEPPSGPDRDPSRVDYRIPICSRPTTSDSDSDPLRRAQPTNTGTDARKPDGSASVGRAEVEAGAIAALETVGGVIGVALGVDWSDGVGHACGGELRDVRVFARSIWSTAEPWLGNKGV